MAISSPPRPTERGVPRRPRALISALVLALIAILARAGWAAEALVETARHVNAR